MRSLSQNAAALRRVRVCVRRVCQDGIGDWPGQWGAWSTAKPPRHVGKYTPRAGWISLCVCVCGTPTCVWCGLSPAAPLLGPQRAEGADGTTVTFPCGLARDTETADGNPEMEHIIRRGCRPSVRPRVCVCLSPTQYIHTRLVPHPTHHCNVGSFRSLGTWATLKLHHRLSGTLTGEQITSPQGLSQRCTMRYGKRGRNFWAEQ